MLPPLRRHILVRGGKWGKYAITDNEIAMELLRILRKAFDTIHFYCEPCGEESFESEGRTFRFGSPARMLWHCETLPVKTE